MKPAILVIDDEQVILQSLTLLFGQEGLVVDTSNDPIQALHRIREHQYGVVLVDIMMPGMRGEEVICKVKEFNPLCNVIVMTAYSNMEHVIECIEAGAVDYVTKPFVDVTLLVGVVRDAVERVERWQKSFGIHPQAGEEG